MSERYITLAEVRDLLTAENEQRELLSVQRAAMEHARAVTFVGGAAWYVNCFLHPQMKHRKVLRSVTPKLRESA